MSIGVHLTSTFLKHYTYLHEHPELSFGEQNTSDYIRKVLDAEGIVYEKAGTTGVIGFIPGQNSEATIALRADMDALPIQESADHPVLSLHKGVMHACGRNLHTACLLGAASYLNSHRDTLPVNVLLIFQHAEEVLPGGAVDIIGHSFFRAHQPQWIIAPHAEPELPVGTVGMCPGQYMASEDEIYIKLYGAGGHAAQPDKTADLVLIASQTVVALQQITSRNASPFMPTVLTFGNIRCDSAINIIPREITLEGILRTFDENWRKQAKERIRTISEAIAESMGAQAEIRIVEGYPCLYNNPGEAALAAGILKSELGDQKVKVLAPQMTTEDFSPYSQLLPATFIRIGVKEDAPCGNHHTPDFYPDTTALEYGIRTFCSLVMSGS